MEDQHRGKEDRKGMAVPEKNTKYQQSEHYDAILVPGRYEKYIERLLRILRAWSSIWLLWRRSSIALRRRLSIRRLRRRRGVKRRRLLEWR